MSLTEFLLARIAEDEQAARDAGADAMVGHCWKHYPREAYEEMQALTLAHSRRVLAECEAKRRIVERFAQGERLVEANAEKHAEVSRGGLDNQAQITALRTHGWELGGRRDGLRFAVDEIAAVYADHPDYREEWKP